MPDSADHFAALRRNPLLLDRSRSRLLVVDVQAKLLPVISGQQNVLRTIRFLLDASAILQIPIVISEQYPQGLGVTDSSIRDHDDRPDVFEKLRFSAADGFRKYCEQNRVEAGRADGRNQIVIAGIETHICVLQTALDLVGHGFQVTVVSDAVGSRHTTDYDVALRRIRDSGGIVSSAESVVFEWCEAAGTDEFRQISRLVRDRDADRILT